MWCAALRSRTEANQRRLPLPRLSIGVVPMSITKRDRIEAEIKADCQLIVDALRQIDEAERTTRTADYDPACILAALMRVRGIPDKPTTMTREDV